MADKLKGRNAVITGAGRGIGRAITLAMAREGASVIVCDLGVSVDGSRDAVSPADEVVKECQSLGVKAVANHGDVSSFQDAEAMVKSCVDNFGRIDILCNIAGIDKPKMIWNMSEEEWDQVVGVHLKGTFNLTRHASRYMREQRFGRIINCVSEAFTGGPSHLNYSSAKGGIATFTFGAARELGRYGITCNAFIPRASTRMFAEDVIASLEKRVAAGIMPPEQLQEIREDLMPPEYFVEFMVFLASDEAADINGQLFLTTPGAIGVWSQPHVERQVRRNPAEHGPWRFEEIVDLLPTDVLIDYANPAPPEPPK
ncbi:MAG: SDR family NAD(P)-dependent oxidoreductase [Dehalococcoidia bacterium]